MLTGDSFHYFIFNISLDNFKSLVYDIIYLQKIEIPLKKKKTNKCLAIFGQIISQL